MRKRIPASERVGKKFNSLTVLAVSDSVGPSGQSMLECVCDCGTKYKAIAANIVNGHTKSCGCAKRASGEAKVVHGHCRRSGPSSEYWAYQHIIDRCHLPSDPAFCNYGERGIFVCPEWRESFENFIRDMGEKPTPKHTLERLDNGLGYGPDNCVWATRTEQARNKRNNVLLEFGGECRCLAEWCEKLDLDYDTVRARVSAYGWSVERSLTTPTNRRWVPYADRPKTQRRQASIQK